VCYQAPTLQQAKTIAAIVDNTFYIYNRHGNPPQISPGTTSLRMGASSMLIVNEMGNIAVVTLLDFLIIFVGHEATELGFLNQRVLFHNKRHINLLKKSNQFYSTI
jgi:hypothetical protein